MLPVAERVSGVCIVRDARDLPVCAALIAASPDVIRRSGPYHSLALKSA